MNLQLAIFKADATVQVGFQTKADWNTFGFKSEEGSFYKRPHIAKVMFGEDSFCAFWSFSLDAKNAPNCSGFSGCPLAHFEPNILALGLEMSRVAMPASNTCLGEASKIQKTMTGAWR